MYLAGPQSQEPYKDGLNHDRFFTLPVLFDDGQGNTLYNTRRRYAPRARVVETAKLAATFPRAAMTTSTACVLMLTSSRTGRTRPSP